MKVLFIIPFLILGFSFSGCGTTPEPKIVTKLEYVKRPLPKLQDKPKGEKYTVLMIEFDGEEYFAIPKMDAGIMSQNWIGYKNWAETNYKILKNLENNQSN